MRIVHEVYSRKPQIGCSGDPYSPRVDDPPPDFPGFQAEMVIVDGSESGADAIFLEGDGEALKVMLRTALEILEDTEHECRRRWEARKSRIKQCPGCGGWILTRHGDGAFLPHSCAQAPGDATTPPGGPGAGSPECAEGASS